MNAIRKTCPAIFYGYKSRESPNLFSKPQTLRKTRYQKKRLFFEPVYERHSEDLFRHILRLQILKNSKPILQTTDLT